MMTHEYQESSVAFLCLTEVEMDAAGALAGVIESSERDPFIHVRVHADLRAPRRSGS